MRGGRQHFTYSKVMAWLAFDRAIKSAEQFALEGPLDHWREVAAAIHADVCRRGYDRELGSFVQSYGSKQLDASLLLLPIVGFLPPEDPRVRGTLRVIERRLLIDGLVMRYDTAASHDGLRAGEGAFLALQLLAGRRLHIAASLARRAGAIPAAARPAKRCRIAERGI
jgi:GH15 family glucan-1,4-alpha-glucosidase